MRILNIKQLKGSPSFMPLNILIILLLVPFIKFLVFFVMEGNCTIVQNSLKSSGNEHLCKRND